MRGFSLLPLQRLEWEERFEGAAGLEVVVAGVVYVRLFFKPVAEDPGAVFGVPEDGEVAGAAKEDVVGFGGGEEDPAGFKFVQGFLESGEGLYAVGLTIAFYPAVAAGEFFLYDVTHRIADLFLIGETSASFCHRGIWLARLAAPAVGRDSLDARTNIGNLVEKLVFGQIYLYL